MRITFNGTLDEFTETIRQKARESQKDIVIYHTDPDVLEIGFYRLGHSGGRFFVANITQENGVITLDGETRNIYPTSDGSFLSKACDFLFTLVFGYLLLEAPLFILWLFLRRFVSIWIPLLLPFAYMAIRPILNKRENEKLDNSFVEFMSSFSHCEEQ
ncbi:MAG: hypothetical protein IJ388_02830 [Oscillospiraceae bacterium]|nr:hypothetical protein [Oscillospiraceae bacterium]